MWALNINYPINAWALLVPNCFTILINYRNILPKIMIISGILSLLTSAIIIIKRHGKFHGMCSEICGVLHGLTLLRNLRIWALNFYEFMECDVSFGVCGDSFSWDLQTSLWLIRNLNRSYVLLDVFLMPCRVLYVMSCFTCIVAVM